MHFQNYGLQKTWLDKCLRSPVSDNPLRENLVNGSNHCFDLNDKIFTRSIDHCERN